MRKAVHIFVHRDAEGTAHDPKTGQFIGTGSIHESNTVYKNSKHWAEEVEARGHTVKHTPGPMGEVNGHFKAVSKNGNHRGEFHASTNAKDGKHIFVHRDAASFSEGDHPRAENGQFGSGAGGQAHHTAHAEEHRRQEAGHRGVSENLRRKGDINHTRFDQFAREHEVAATLHERAVQHAKAGNAEGYASHAKSAIKESKKLGVSAKSDQLGAALSKHGWKPSSSSRAGSGEQAYSHEKHKGHEITSNGNGWEHKTGAGKKLGFVAPNHPDAAASLNGHLHAFHKTPHTKL